MKLILLIIVIFSSLTVVAETNLQNCANLVFADLKTFNREIDTGKQRVGESQLVYLQILMEQYQRDMDEMMQALETCDDLSSWAIEEQKVILDKVIHDGEF